MLNFGILLKSYDKDFDLAERLIESFNRFNPEQLQMFIVVPEADVERFRIFESDTISVLSESLLAQHLVDHEVAGIRPGYINQEIVKLAFWELGLASNYFCLDSDAVFIRPVIFDDFMFNSSTPFSVLVEDRQLEADSEYFSEHWEGRAPQLAKIYQAIGLQSRPLRTCHGHQVMSSRVLASLRNDFMYPRQLTYAALLEMSPYEFTWYNAWLQKSRIIEIVAVEPLVHVFHTYRQYLEWSMKGNQVEDFGRSYLAIVLNSNFMKVQPRDLEMLDPVHALAQYFTTDQIVKAFRIREANQFRSRWKLIKEAARTRRLLLTSLYRGDRRSGETNQNV